MDDFDDIDDADFSALADAAEKVRQAANSITQAPPGQVAGPSKQPVVQPVPRKIQKPAGPNSIIVNTRQKGNPLLPYIKLVPWEYGDIPPDYLPNPTTSILFLSLKYHRLHPEYIYTRIKNLGRAYTLRVLLLLVDTEQHSDPLKELTKAGLVHNLTLILAWSPAEAGKYVELYKTLENAPATSIKERQKEDYMSRVEDFVTSVKGVNKTDAMGLIAMFGSMRAAVNASEEVIGMIPGWGEKKTRRWVMACRENFRVGGAIAKKRDGEEGVSNTGDGLSQEDRLALNQRLGIAGPTIEKTKGAVETIDIDDDDVQAMLEVEEEERRRKQPPQEAVVKEKPTTIEPKPDASATTEDAVMAALAKLRKQ